VSGGSEGSDSLSIGRYHAGIHHNLYFYK